ncbi:2OG-Fe(II) oxygenase [Reyranella sp.]|uniref:2OG-Fe(II) oxygenase family protein n=1 Tax=Reyranella sp. TaxID=1929291 RepID=UPI0025DBAA3C|nr:2OG-Fe(II) oxygenase [Reyranella sp.]
MPRITLPLASGALFDSWDAVVSGFTRIYWLGALPDGERVATMMARLPRCEASLCVVAPQPLDSLNADAPCILDRGGELARAFGARGTFAIVVDAAGRVAALLPSPVPDDVVALAEQLYGETEPVVVRNTAPIMLLNRVLDAELCRCLIEYWSARDKVASIVGSDDGNVVDTQTKRRLDTNLDDPGLFARVRDSLVRRVVPAIAQASHIHTSVIEAPRIGCYDVASGGWFLRHRDNTSRMTAHRQFAVSINLNPGDEYEGGELRFAEFGRQLYRPAVGCAVVFSAALLHEVNPVTRGRRFGLFTFLSSSGSAAGYGPRHMAR